MVSLISCANGPEGMVCKVSAPPSDNAPDGILRWAARCEDLDVGRSPQNVPMVHPGK